MVVRCTKDTTASNVTVKEKGKRANFLNPENLPYSVTQVDGCLITSGRKVDYLVSKKGKCSAVIELKGRGIEHACSQIEASMQNKDLKEIIEEKVGFIVVTSRSPSFDSFVAKAKQKYAREYKAGFFIATGSADLDIEDVASISGSKKKR